VSGDGLQGSARPCSARFDCGLVDSALAQCFPGSFPPYFPRYSPRSCPQSCPRSFPRSFVGLSSILSSFLPRFFSRRPARSPSLSHVLTNPPALPTTTASRTPLSTKPTPSPPACSTISVSGSASPNALQTRSRLTRLVLAVPTTPSDGLEAAQIALGLTHSFRAGKPVFFGEDGKPIID
jgi:hypothetical protein